MKGLILKDLAHIKSQKLFFAVIFLIGGFYAFAMETPEFAIGYIVMMASVFILNTIAYDEHNNGNAFLFTMPFTRAEYVKAKYILGIFFIGVSAVSIFAVCSAVIFMKSGSFEMELLAGTVVVFVVGIVLMSLNLPIHLKYGSEKGKIVMMVIIIGGCALLYLLEDTMGVLSKLEPMIDNIETFSMGMVLALVLVIAAVGLLISLCISVKIVEKKEF